MVGIDFVLFRVGGLIMLVCKVGESNHVCLSSGWKKSCPFVGWVDAIMTVCRMGGISVCIVGGRRIHNVNLFKCSSSNIYLR